MKMKAKIDTLIKEVETLESQARNITDKTKKAQCLETANALLKKAGQLI